MAQAEAAFRAANRLSCLIVEGEDWHPGVVGLIASRLKEKFNIPSFSFASNGEKLTGSGRSLAGVDIGRAVRRAVDLGLVEKGGGHAMAAGVTLSRNALPAFRDFLEEALAASVEAARDAAALAIDGVLSGRGLNLDFLARLEKAGPFGQGNPEPVFVLPAQRIVDSAVVGDGHVRARLRCGDGATRDAIAFRAADGPRGAALLRQRDTLFHVAARVSVNHFRGTARPQAAIADIAPMS
jgi:single-stranded-DNA-specific exonuclease